MKQSISPTVAVVVILVVVIIIVVVGYFVFMKPKAEESVPEGSLQQESPGMMEAPPAEEPSSQPSSPVVGG
ncbi:MAG: hypothetical protein ACUVX8_01160 [Candidatus Zipacnadales bacterium]